MRTSRLLPVLLFAISSTAFAVTIPCAKPASSQALCTNAKFASAARQLTAAYAHMDRQLSQAAVSAMGADAKAWLAWNDTMCPPEQSVTARADCLLPLYQNQTEMLTEGTKTIHDMHFYPREKVMIVRESHPPRQEIHDPGYGAGRFTWPQIDHPTRAQAKWNSAAGQEALRLVSRQSKGAPQNPFDPAPLLDKQVFASYNLTAANHRLIVVTFTQEVFPYGAAHPDDTIHHMNWWLRCGRELRASDVFRKDSDWKPFLLEASYNALIAETKRSQNPLHMFPKDESYEGARKAVYDTSNWAVTRDGLIIRFPRYSVAAGYVGWPRIQLSWRTLRPYLNPHLHPAGLPRLKRQRKP